MFEERREKRKYLTYIAKIKRRWNFQLMSYQRTAHPGRSSLCFSFLSSINIHGCSGILLKEGKSESSLPHRSFISSFLPSLVLFFFYLILTENEILIISLYTFPLRRQSPPNPSRIPRTYHLLNPFFFLGGGGVCNELRSRGFKYAERECVYVESTHGAK